MKKYLRNPEEKGILENIHYKSDGFAKYYSVNRHHWDEFYESERYIMSRFMDSKDGPFSVLDVGCGCGGLGEALSEKYQLSMYKGVDINLPNVKIAQSSLKLNCPFEIVCEDVTELTPSDGYDFVISFSCIDFNIEVEKMIASCWKQTKKGGHLILSVRLTNEMGVNDIEKSYQPIGVVSKATEVANYVVFNFNDLFKMIKEMPVLGGVTAYGYWNAPSSTAHTPYNRLCFSVVCLEKSEVKQPYADLRLPIDLFG